MSDNDIVARLRAWRSLHLTRLGELFDEAADRIAIDAETISAMIADWQAMRDRLVNGATLADAEREAIGKAAVAYSRREKDGVGLLDDGPAECAKIAATLRNLLERLA